MSDKPNGITITKKQLVIITVVVLLLVCGGVILGLNWSKWFGGEDIGTISVSQQADSSTSSTAEGIELDPNAGDYNGQKPEDKGGAAQGIKIPGYPSITIAKDTQDVTMALLNPEDNPCYFKFVIVLKDGNETVFESKYVEPGKAISDVHLTRALAEGEYPATIQITTISLDGETPLNGANVETIPVVK